MSDGFDITLDLKAPTGGLDDYLRKMKAIEARQKQINKLAGQGMASGQTPAVDPTQKIVKQLERTQRVQAQRVPKFTQGPAQRLDAAIRNQSNANTFGSPAAQFDAGIATQRAQKAYQAAIKAAAPTTSDQTAKAFKTAMLSMRGAAGKGGGIPGMGAIVGLAESFGPLGIAITAAVGAFDLIKAAAERASQSMTDFISAQTTSGGTATQTAVLRGIGGAAGRSPQEAAADAMKFAQDMSSNPFSTSLFQKFGVKPDFDPAGHFNPDKATNFIRGLDAFLNKMTDSEAEKAVHASPELAPYYNLRNLPAAQRQNIIRDAMQDAGTYSDPSRRRDAASYNAAASRASLATKQAAAQATQETMTPLFNSWANLLRNPSASNAGSLAKSSAPFMGPIAALAKAAHAAYEMRRGGSGASGSGGSAKKVASALDANTQAINKNTSAMQYVPTMVRQVFGGGDRASGAVPARWRFHVLQQVMDHHLARTLGAFSQ